MSRTLELPDPVYDALVEAAKASGETPVGWIAARLPRAAPGNGRSSLPMPDAEEIAQANARLREHMVDLGHAVGCDNEQIDADLAREYGDDHADLYGSGKGDK
jgi:hypothetical protein